MPVKNVPPWRFARGSPRRRPKDARRGSRREHLAARDRALRRRERARCLPPLSGQSVTFGGSRPRGPNATRGRRGGGGGCRRWRAARLPRHRSRLRGVSAVANPALFRLVMTLDPSLSQQSKGSADLMVNAASVRARRSRCPDLLLAVLVTRTRTGDAIFSTGSYRSTQTWWRPSSTCRAFSDFVRKCRRPDTQLSDVRAHPSARARNTPAKAHH